MDESVEIRIVDGRVLAYGMEVDDHLDIDRRLFEVSRTLPKERMARVCFNAGRHYAIRTVPLVRVVGRVE